MISKEEVKHIAKLARLELKDDEIVKMQKDLSSILDYFKIIQNLKIKMQNDNLKSEIKKNITRNDEVLEKKSSLRNNLIASAPDKKDDYIKVKSIL